MFHMSFPNGHFNSTLNLLKQFLGFRQRDCVEFLYDFWLPLAMLVDLYTISFSIYIEYAVIVYNPSKMRSECEKSVCDSLCAEHYIFLCFIYVCVYFVMRKSENVWVCNENVFHTCDLVYVYTKRYCHCIRFPLNRLLWSLTDVLDYFSCPINVKFRYNSV